MWYQPRGLIEKSDSEYKYEVVEIDDVKFKCEPVGWSSVENKRKIFECEKMDKLFFCKQGEENQKEEP